MEVIVAIPAYNAEENIRYLVDSLLIQKETNFLIKKIIVYSDASTDKTIKSLQNIKNRKLLLIDSTKRRGFAGAVKFILRNYILSDAVLLLNDDIIITDNSFVEKIVNKYSKAQNAGLVCANPMPLKSNRFIENAVSSGYFAYKRMSMYLSNGINIFTCDGKLMLLSREFINTINLPKNESLMGNVDAYFYFVCKKNKFNYIFVPNALYYFRSPSTIADFVKWQKRNYMSHEILNKTFGSIVEKEFRKPKIIFLYFRIVEFLRNPFGSLVIFLLGIYCSNNTKLRSNEFNSKWDIVRSTKTIKLHH